MKKRGITMIIIILPIVLITGAIIIPFVIATRTPVKYAIRIEDLYKYPNSILVREAWHTGTGWEQVGDATGYFDDEEIEDVHLVGYIPPTFSPGGDHINTFLCQVQYLDYYEIEGSDIKYKEYKVLDWYPIYPVKRYTILPSCFFPDDYISNYDLIIFKYDLDKEKTHLSKYNN